MMKFLTKNKSTVIFLLLSFSLLEISFTQEEKNIWEDYPIWENTTKYSKTYVVNQNHKSACDTNSGTEKAPLLTIDAAIKRAKPGEKILIHKGTYREIITPIKGGLAPDKMISIESAEGEEVIIKGSKILSNEWAREIKPGKRDIPPSVTVSRSKKLWITTLEDTVFRNGYFPLKKINLEENEASLMPRTETVKNTSPLTLTRAMLYQNGKRMVQLNHYGDLIYVPGSFWIDTDKKTVHIHPYENKDPNKEKFELAICSHLLKPKQNGLAYIQIKGLIFEHCANGFFRTGNGAVNTFGGHHWIFENNIIREVNAAGLEFGTKTFDGIPEQIKDTITPDNQKGFINVRNNRIYACGTAGIISNVVPNAIIKNNEIMFCGWQEAEHYGECAGIKLIECSHSLISYNHIHHHLGCAGIWLQWNNTNCRITKNIIDDIATDNGALIIEASFSKNLIDNNLVWNIEGPGINGHNSDNQSYIYNLTGYIMGPVVKLKSDKDLELDSINFSAKRNLISNNMFVDFTENLEISSPLNTINNNLFVFNTKLENVELKRWQERIISKRGAIMRADVGLNTNTLVFKWSSKYEIQPVPSMPEVKEDFMNNERSFVTTIPGPFKTLPRNSDYYISLKLE